MATVYLAHDLKHQRGVALKVLHPDLAHALGPERFRREIEIAARLQHPHILPVFDSGEHDGMLWYTMPFIEGESLRDLLRREGELPLDLAVQITREVADALDYAHTLGVIHRDIKPENILLSRGHALVADFGIARAVSAEGGNLTATGMAIGTPAYMSPEQGEGERQVTARSDVYSLATVTYEMLTGEQPYAGPTARAVITKRMTDPVPSARRLRSTVSESLDRAIMRGLAPTPADRYATAGEFARALTDITGLRTATAPLRLTRPMLAAAVLVVAVVAIWLIRPGATARGTTSGAHRLAADHVSRGTAILAKRTPAAFTEAMSEFQLALAADSTNASALAKIGYAYTLFVDWGWPYQGLSAAALRARAMEYSERALASDSTSADAWLTRAYVLTAGDPYRLRGAPEAFRRALDLDSTSAEAWYQYGQALQILGRSDKAVQAYRRSFALDPNRPMTLMSMSALSLRAGRIGEARALIDSALTASRTNTSPYVRVVRGMVALADGEIGRAEAEGELALVMDTAYRVPARSLLAMVYAAQGKSAKATAQVDTLEQEMGPDDPSPTSVRFAACALLALGRKEDALRLIERAKPRGATLWFYMQSREFAPVRSEPRFQKVYREADPTSP